MRILVVEDNPVNLDLVVQLLEDDHEILTAEDGQAGIDLALQSQPDLILMDLSLPRKNGWEACQALRDSGKLDGTPIVALTAHAIKGDREKALAAGFDDYVTKPIDEDQLFAVLERYDPQK
ncbi:MAG: response regulator [Candidatus Eremiobacteraeota bacterium]|nr:response regulator [Candidatus Eremiobacteraeota bacterium]